MIWCHLSQIELVLNAFTRVYPSSPVTLNCHLTYRKKKNNAPNITSHHLSPVRISVYTKTMAKQPILKELEYFVGGATTAATISPSGLSHLVHCGLNLLHNLPASKDAVFEYFTIFFDAAVAGYVKLMEVRIYALCNFSHNKIFLHNLNCDENALTLKSILLRFCAAKRSKSCRIIW